MFYNSKSIVSIVVVQGFMVTVAVLKKASHVVLKCLRVPAVQHADVVVSIVRVESNVDVAVTVIGIDVAFVAEGGIIVSVKVQS